MHFAKTLQSQFLINFLNYAYNIYVHMRQLTYTVSSLTAMQWWFYPYIQPKIFWFIHKEGFSDFFSWNSAIIYRYLTYWIDKNLLFSQNHLFSFLIWIFLPFYEQFIGNRESFSFTIRNCIDICYKLSIVLYFQITTSNILFGQASKLNSQIQRIKTSHFMRFLNHL